MANVLTVRKMVALEWNENDSGNNTDLLNIAICRALRDLRPKVFSFNIGKFSLTTVVGQESYAIATRGESETNLLPWDFRGLIGSQIHLSVAGASSNVRTMEIESPDEYERYSNQFNTNSVPSLATFQKRSLYLTPSPISTDTVTGEYLKDLDTPYPRYNNALSSWEYVGSRGDLLGFQVAAAFQEDNSGSTYVDLSSDLQDADADDVSPFPAGAGDNDAIYFGVPNVFEDLSVSVGTAGVGAYAVTWEYWDGTAWSALAGVTDNTSAFQTAGVNTVIFTRPTDWVKTTVNSSASYFYVRARRDSGAVTTDPLLSQVTGTFDGFTNLWFTEAAEVISARAAYYFLLKGVHDMQRAAKANADYEIALQELKRNDRYHQSVGYIHPRLAS